MGFILPKKTVKPEAPSGKGEVKIKKVFAFSWPDGTSVEFIRAPEGFSMNLFGADGQLVLKTDSMNHKHFSELIRTLE